MDSLSKDKKQLNGEPEGGLTFGAAAGSKEKGKYVSRG